MTYVIGEPCVDALARACAWRNARRTASTGGSGDPPGRPRVLMIAACGLTLATAARS